MLSSACCCWRTRLRWWTCSTSTARTGNRADWLRRSRHVSRRLRRRTSNAGTTFYLRVISRRICDGCFVVMGRNAGHHRHFSASGAACHWHHAVLGSAPSPPPRGRRSSGCERRRGRYSCGRVLQPRLYRRRERAGPDGCCRSGLCGAALLEAARLGCRHRRCTHRLSGAAMKIERATPAQAGIVARLLHDFNHEFETPVPPVG